LGIPEAEEKAAAVAERAAGPQSDVAALGRLMIVIVVLAVAGGGVWLINEM
jgi:hypothetical protein